MKGSLLVISLLLFKSHSLAGQNIPGLSYCLLFDSNLEKEAFQNSSNNDCDPLIFLLAYDARIDSARYIDVRNELFTYAQKLQAKRSKFKDESKFLRYVFYDVHKKYLKHYKRSETFSNIFNNREYNCVSGTALYACLLSQLGYRPNIYETRYHIFLTVTLDSGDCILFEATDPAHGFVNDFEKVEERVALYLENEAEEVTKQESLSAPFNKDIVFKSISLHELAALHYYNLAVDFINQENYYEAFRVLKKAHLLYPDSKRIQDFITYTHLKYESELLSAF
jgi:hypothetical protein